MARPTNNASVPDGLSEPEAELVRRLMAVLPEGWVIARTERGVVPEGWLSEHATGFMVEGQSGTERFRTWFLPRDWIGIRKVGTGQWQAHYWEGILASRELTSVTVSSERTIPEKLREMGLSTPSIVNSGWAQDEEVFRGRFASAEAEAERLIEAHCHDRAAEDEAAHSLVALGIPAGAVFRRAAAAGSGLGRQLCISTLSYFPGEESVATIARLLCDPATPEPERGYAAQVAGDLVAPVLGLALLVALGFEVGVDTQSKIIRSLARRRHAPAGPAVLAALEATDNPHYKVGFATSLASLRYLPAEAAIRKLAEEPSGRGDDRISNERQGELQQRARLALKVLTGAWGEPVGGVRFSLEGPESVTLGERIRVWIYVENVSEETGRFFQAVSGHFVIDEVAHERRPRPTNGMDSLFPNAVRKSAEDVEGWMAAPGRYRIHYENGAARSNAITLVVKPAGGG